MILRTRYILPLLLALLLLPAFANGQNFKDPIGYTELKAEKGAALENGAGIKVLQPEAPDQGAYMPEGTVADFAGKTFTNGTIPVETAKNDHATFVGRFFYGNSFSMTGGITDITGANANDYLNRYTGLDTGGAPLTQKFNISNHSYVGDIPRGLPAAEQAAAIAEKIDLMRRFDYIINRDNMIAVVGANNWFAGNQPPPTPDFLATSYNGITVGRTDGLHSQGLTTEYGAGRFKPDIVVPLTFTSAATPVVGSAAAILQQAAGFNGAGLANDGGQNEVIKATLFAGATKEEFGTDWDRTSTRPIDEVFGFGELNIRNSYHIWEGGQFEGSTSDPASNVGLMGWDYGQYSGSGSLFYDFEIAMGQTLSELSAVLAWNVDVVDDPGTQAFDLTHSLANFDLALYNSTGAFMGSLIDSSISTEYNYEHIYLKSLAAGNYTFRITGDTPHDFGFSWRITTVAVPEPSSALLIGVACTGVIMRRRRR